MLPVFGTLMEIVTNRLRWLRLTIRSLQAIKAENLFRRQWFYFSHNGMIILLFNTPACPIPLSDSARLSA